MNGELRIIELIKGEKSRLDHFWKKFERSNANAGQSISK